MRLLLQISNFPANYLFSWLPLTKLLDKPRAVEGAACSSESLREADEKIQVEMDDGELAEEFWNWQNQ